MEVPSGTNRKVEELEVYVDLKTTKYMYSAQKRGKRERDATSLKSGKKEINFLNRKLIFLKRNNRHDISIYGKKIFFL